MVSLPTETKISKDQTLNYMNIKYSLNYNDVCFVHRRARLATETLTDIMVVKCESPAVENFNPNEAIFSWLVNTFLVLHKSVILKLELSVFYNMN